MSDSRSYTRPWDRHYVHPYYDDKDDRNVVDVKSEDGSKPTTITQNARGGGATNIVNHYEININIASNTNPEQLKALLEIINGTDDDKKKQLFDIFKKKK